MAGFDCVVGALVMGVPVMGALVIGALAIAALVIVGRLKFIAPMLGVISVAAAPLAPCPSITLCVGKVSIGTGSMLSMIAVGCMSG